MAISDKVRNVLTGGLVAVVLILGIGLTITFNKYQFYKLDAASKQETIDAQDETARLKKESDKITENSDKTITQETEAVRKNSEKIKEAVDAEVERIKEDFQQREQAEKLDKDQAAKLQETRDRKISETRLNGLWQLYCTGSTDVTLCPNQTQGDAK